MLAWAEHTAGDIPRAMQLFQENVELYRQADHLLGVASELGNLADLACEAGDLEPAAEFLSESLALATSLGSAYLLPSLLGSAAVLTGRRGRPEEALELAAASEQQYAAAGLEPDPGDGVDEELRLRWAAEVGEERASEFAGRGRHHSSEEAARLAAALLR